MWFDVIISSMGHTDEEEDEGGVFFSDIFNILNIKILEGSHGENRSHLPFSCINHF